MGQGAGLVKDDGVNLLRHLQGLAAFHQHPSWAPRPVPTMIEVGWPAPWRRGSNDQYAMKIRRAKEKSACPMKYQDNPARMARTMTVGRNTD